jgi:hypothetical protein
VDADIMEYVECFAGRSCLSAQFTYPRFLSMS